MVTIQEVLSQWEAVGVFDFLLPFLLIFAIIYGILTATNVLSGNKGVNIVISVVIGLMSLRLGFVQEFFTEVFPRLGVGVAAFLIILILTGLFLPKGKSRAVVFWIYVGVGAIIAIIVLGSAYSATQAGFLSSYGDDLIVWIISIALLLALIIVIVVGKAEQPDQYPTVLDLIRPMGN